MTFLEFPAEHVVNAAVDAWERDGTPLPDAAARCIASWWHSPRNGLAELSTAGLVSRAVVGGVESELADVTENPEGWSDQPAARRQLSALLAYVTDSRHTGTVDCACCGIHMIGLRGDSCETCDDGEHDPATSWHCFTDHCDGSGCTYPGECEGLPRPDAS